MRRLVLSLFSLGIAFISINALAVTTLTVTPVTWNIVGLDSNNPPSGPRFFPVGARVCSSVATTSVAVNFVFDSANANVNRSPPNRSRQSRPGRPARPMAR